MKVLSAIFPYTPKWGSLCWTDEQSHCWRYKQATATRSRCIHSSLSAGAHHCSKRASLGSPCRTAQPKPLNQPPARALGRVLRWQGEGKPSASSGERARSAWPRLLDARQTSPTFWSSPGDSFWQIEGKAPRCYKWGLQMACWHLNRLAEGQLHASTCNRSGLDTRFWCNLL